MKIDIYTRRAAFVAVPAGNPVPPHAEGWRWFKSIDLQPNDVRIGLADPSEVLQAIHAVGWSAM